MSTSPAFALPAPVGAVKPDSRRLQISAGGKVVAVLYCLQAPVHRPEEPWALHYAGGRIDRFYSQKEARDEVQKQWGYVQYTLLPKEKAVLTHHQEISAMSTPTSQVTTDFRLATVTQMTKLRRLADLLQIGGTPMDVHEAKIDGQYLLVDPVNSDPYVADLGAQMITHFTGEPTNSGTAHLRARIEASLHFERLIETRDKVRDGQAGPVGQLWWSASSPGELLEQATKLASAGAVITRVDQEMDSDRGIIHYVFELPREKAASILGYEPDVEEWVESDDADAEERSAPAARARP